MTSQKPSEIKRETLLSIHLNIYCSHLLLFLVTKRQDTRKPLDHRNVNSTSQLRTFSVLRVTFECCVSCFAKYVLIDNKGAVSVSRPRGNGEGVGSGRGGHVSSTTTARRLKQAAALPVLSAPRGKLNLFFLHRFTQK